MGALFAIEDSIDKAQCLQRKDRIIGVNPHKQLSLQGRSVERTFCFGGG